MIFLTSAVCSWDRQTQNICLHLSDIKTFIMFTLMNFKTYSAVKALNNDVSGSSSEQTRRERV